MIIDCVFNVQCIMYNSGETKIESLVVVGRSCNDKVRRKVRETMNFVKTHAIVAETSEAVRINRRAMTARQDRRHKRKCMKDATWKTSFEF